MNVSVEERICKIHNMNVVEDLSHFPFFVVPLIIFEVILIVIFLNVS